MQHHFGGNLSKKVIESRYIGHFLIIGKIILHFPKLSVILRNYQQHYRIENLRKIIEKLSLSKNLTYRPPLVRADATWTKLN